jgi:soluble lytic murein transglycosylase-like protein
MTPLTPFQMECLATIKRLCEPLPWLLPSYIMAHVRVESGWDPNAKAFDFDTTGSLGLMQVTAAAAADRGYDGQDQTIPIISLATGVAHISWTRAYLMRKWGFKDTILYHPIAEAYNEGVGNVLRGRRDAAYYLKWSYAQQCYAFVDGGK